MMNGVLQCYNHHKSQNTTNDGQICPTLKQLSSIQVTEFPGTVLKLLRCTILQTDCNMTNVYGINGVNEFPVRATLGGLLTWPLGAARVADSS